MGETFAAANKVVEVTGSRTALEHIFYANRDRRTMASHSFFNKVLFEGKNGDLNGIPREIRNWWPFAEGTAGVIGNAGKPLGKVVETECYFEETKKTIIFKPNGDEAYLTETLLACDHGFAPDGTPFLFLSDIRNRPIRTDDDIRKANEVFLTFRGKVLKYEIKSRDGGVLEAIDNETNFSWFSYSETVSLLKRTFPFGEYGNRCVLIDTKAYEHLWALMEAPNLA